MQDRDGELSLVSLLDKEVAKYKNLQTELRGEQLWSTQLESKLEESRVKQEEAESRLDVFKDVVSANEKLQQEVHKTEKVMSAV